MFFEVTYEQKLGKGKKIIKTRTSCSELWKINTCFLFHLFFRALLSPIVAVCMQPTALLHKAAEGH